MVNYTFEPENDRVAAYSNDCLEVGKITFKAHEEVWEADHTYVNPDFRGGTIASDLLQLLVEKAREQGKRIYPTCSYVSKVFERTPEYHDVYQHSL